MAGLPAPRTIVGTHAGADFDGIAGMFAVQKLYPEALPVLCGGVASEVREFLALHGELFRCYALEELDLGQVTQLIGVDVADPARLGALVALSVRPEVRTRLYDHHPLTSVADPARIERVHRPYGAVTTLLVEQIQERGLPIAPLEATLLLLGIAADTAQFTTSSVTANDFHAAGFLLGCGAAFDIVQRFLAVRLNDGQAALLTALQQKLRHEHLGAVSLALAECALLGPLPAIAPVVQQALAQLDDDALIVIVRHGEKTLVVGRARSRAIDLRRVLGPWGAVGHAGAASVTVDDAAEAPSLDAIVAQAQRVIAPEPTAVSLMSSPVQTIAPGTSIENADRQLRQLGHSGLVVVDDTGRLIGIVSRRDVDKGLQHGLGHAPVQAVMSAAPLVVDAAAPLSSLLEAIATHNVGRLPVVRAGSLVGIVTRSDLVRALHRAHLQHDPPLEQLVHDERLARMLDRLPQPIRNLLDQAGAIGDELGLSVALVGGAVRDLWLGRPLVDIDLVVEGDAFALARHLAERFALAATYHERFQTAQLALPASWGAGDHLDVATVRGEWYANPGALPEVHPGGRFEDTRRRDITINAIGLQLNGGAGRRGELIDRWNGLADLQRGLIRILHPLSFVEDPTRILRVIRFAARYQFQLEPATEHALRTALAAQALQTVSPPRLRIEVDRLCREPHAGRALLAAQELGVWVAWNRQWQPLASDPLDDARLTAQAESWKVDGADIARLLLFAALPPEAAGALARALQYDNGTIAAIESVAGGAAARRRALESLRTVSAAAPSARHELLADLSRGAAAALDALWNDPLLRRWLEEEFERVRQVTLEITGDELLQAGVPAGPEVGRRLRVALAAKIDGRAAGKAEELRCALEA